MPLKPIEASLHNAKVLLVIMLLALSTTGMATAEGTPDDALRTSQDSYTLNVDHTLASRQKRSLRSSVDVTTSDNTNNVIVRRLSMNLAGLEGIPASLRQSWSKTSVKIIPKIQVLWWRLWQKTPEDVFKSLKLDEMQEKLLESPKFSTWKAFVVATSPTEEDAIAKMFQTMVNALGGEAAVAKILGQKISSHTSEDTVKRLRDFQINEWKTSEKTVEDVFDLLKLNKLSANKLFDSLEFNMWRAFISKTDVSPEKTLEVLLKKYEATELTEAMLAAKKTSYARTLVRVQVAMALERTHQAYLDGQSKASEADRAHEISESVKPHEIPIRRV